MILIAKSLGYISKVSIFVCKLIIMLMNFLEFMGHRTKRILRIERKEYQTY